MSALTKCVCFLHVIKIDWASFFKQEQQVVVFQGAQIYFEFLILDAKRKQNKELSSSHVNL